MPVDALHTIERINIAGSSAFQLGSISNRSVDFGIELHKGYGSGQLQPSHVSVMSQAPMVRATTSELARFFTNVSPLLGLALPTSTTYTTAQIAWVKAALLGGLASGSVHYTATVNRGMVIPTQIAVEQGGVAALDFDIHAFYNGTNLPFVLADSQALASGTPAIDEQFTLGPVFINNVQVPGLEGCTWDFGFEIEKASTDGQVYPTTGRIMRVTPVFTLRSSDVVTQSDFGLSGTAFDGSNACAVYFQKMEANGDRIAIATTEHVQVLFSVAQGMVIIKDGASGANQERARTTIELHPIVGASAIFAIDVTAAIPSFS